MATLTAVVSGDLITDAVRAAQVAGDGRASDSSYGIYYPRANVIPNAQANLLSGWVATGSGAISADTSVFLFSPRSVKFTPTSGAAGGLSIGSSGGGGLPLLLGGGGSGRLTVAPTTVYTMSVWARATSTLNRAIRATMKAYDSTGSALANAFTNQTFTPPSNGVWTRFQWTFTTGASVTTLLPFFDDGTAGGAGGTWAGTDIWWLDGPQLEQGYFASPFIPSPTQPSRATPRVQVQPVGNSQNGSVALRFRPAYDGPTGQPNGGTDARLYAWADDATHRIVVLYNASTHQWQLVVQNGATTNTVSVAATHTPGSSVTVLASWASNGTCRISLNGGTWVTNTVAGAVPNLATTSADVGSGGTIFANSFAEGEVLWLAAWNAALSQQSDANAVGALTDTDPNSLATLPAGAALLWTAQTASYTTATAATRTLTDTGLTQTDTLVKNTLGPKTNRTVSDTGLTQSDAIALGQVTRVANDSYADGASATFGATLSTNAGHVSLFTDVFSDYVAPANETPVYYGRLPLIEAQPALASTPVEQGTATNVRCCWHGQLIDTERGSMFLVRAGSALEDRVGRRVRISVRGARNKSVTGFVHGVADLPEADDISVSRRLFMELSLPGIDDIPVTVESLQTT